MPSKQSSGTQVHTFLFLHYHTNPVLMSLLADSTQSTDSLPPSGAGAQQARGAGAQQVRSAGAQHARGAGAQHALGAGAAYSPAAAAAPRSSARKSTGDETEDDQDQPLFPKNSKKRGHKAR